MDHGHEREKTADIFGDYLEITPSMDMDQRTSCVDPRSQDFLIQSDVFFALVLACHVESSW